ncbi:MAG: Protoheme ferro-lyase (ferrochelatase) [uncultured bacterium]|nr:MAG: Protoheme ferro-lyase (ferrochelatase) [uncultured bacterium]OFW67959.1 MAG: ferrochelatase [Alphaproteobacteria bacterium GWC2_42_16]OFW74662.1 MAG: ferrochelatase [Alphaproteobacteria bacterium GWA2_41_27]OFW84966.1 MAG: ferrochelatase [Alphaproteobacteria bacterium RIFCSPHIGHO2_12_FULL_42_100]OFW85567.1 MAG: ferrochelatase [Alphaproteobacteria bacterium RBG_16_42_14]OFW92106.1 MAG: ferrochelatase [Alphaproteobacteria bacterium RIFCSPHIGHO2_12_42_13]OFW93055.1 MAG: ferrochelatase [A
MKKTAIVLFNLGGPLSQDKVKDFLFSLFYDPSILTLPNPLRFFLAKLITRARLKEAKHIYSFLGGGSPLLQNTRMQALALERELGKDYKVFIAMRHATPFIEDAWREIQKYNPQEILLLPLYPQFSTTTTGSSLTAWKKVAKGKQKIPTRLILSYPSETGLIQALRDRTLFHYEKAKKSGHPKVLLTAHGLPEKVIRKGDSYQHQVEQTTASLIKALQIPRIDFILCYQSRVGPLKWLGPYTQDEIIKASREKRPLVIVPISFVSEHPETLVELDVFYRERALQEGCPSFHRVETVQTHPFFIKGLANLIRQQKEGTHVL